MKQTLTKPIIALCFLISITGIAQRKADKVIEFEGNIEELFFHDFSAVPIVLTDKDVAGIDGAKGDKIWEATGDRISLLGGIIQSDESNYEEVPFSPYIIVSNLLVDTRSGKSIIDGERDKFNKINSFQIIPELESYIFQCTTEEKSVNKIYYVSLSTNSSLWVKDIEVKKKGDLGNIVVTAEDNLAFTINKNLLILNGKTGDVILNEENEVGELFLNPNRDVMYAVEASSNGIGATFGAAMTLNANKLAALGDKIYAYNTVDGSEYWKKPLKLDEGYLFSQEVDGKLFIQHEKAGSLYDYTNGEEIWKRDFGKRSTYKIEKESDGYMVYYGARKMLLGEDGKEQWKRAQTNGPEYLDDLGDDDSYDEFDFSNGSIIATVYRIAYYENGEKKPVWKFAVDEDTRLTYDEKEGTVIVLDGKRLYLLNPDKGWGEGNNQKLDLEKPEDFNMMEIRGSKYFISSPWEYVILDKSGKIEKQHYYVQPGESGRKWLNALSVVGSVAGAAYQMGGMYNMTAGVGSGMYETFSGVRAPGTGGFGQVGKGVDQYVGGKYGQMASEALYNPNRYNASSNTRDYAFFFTKSDAGEKYLVQVSKDTGEEVDKLIFENNKPMYHVDEVEKRVYYIKGKSLHIFDYK